MAILTVYSYVVVTPGRPLPPVTSVALPHRHRPPAKRLIAYYGNNTILHCLGKVRQKLLTENKEFYRVDISIDGGRYVAERQWLKDLPKNKVLHIELAPLETQQKLLATVGRKSLEDLSRNPSLLEKMWKSKTFGHLAAVMWRDWDEDGTPLTFAAVHPDRIEKVEIFNYRDPVAPKVTVKV